jgi:3-methylcrotonyl-CoA carboxylase alpha subunit
MLAKLVAWGEDREQARQRLLSMLEETCVGGFANNLAFLRRVLAHPAFADAELDTGFIARHQEQLLPAVSELPAAFWQLAAEAWLHSEAPRRSHEDYCSPWSAANGWRSGLPAEADLQLSCGEQRHTVHLRGPAQSHLQGEQLWAERDGLRQAHRAIRRGAALYLEWQGRLHEVRRVDPIAEAEASHAQHGGLTAPMNGSIVRVLVEAGQAVDAGQALVVLEAMKMEHSIRAPHAGTVKALYCTEGELVSEGAALVELE